MNEPRTVATALDHVVLLVGDLDAAAETFTRLGFTVTPESQHSMGSRNRCIMLADQSYIELLDIGERHGGDGDFQKLMARGNRVAGLAFRTSLLEQTRELLAETGIPTREIQRFSRPVETRCESAIAEFAVCHIPLDVSEDYKLFFCDHLTPDLLWTSGATVHPNGVEAMAAVRLAASAPGKFAACLGGVLGVDRGSQTETLLDGAGRMICLEQGEPASSVTTLRLTTPDHKALVGCLRANGIAFRICENGSLVIVEVDSLGFRLVFTSVSPKEGTK